LHDSDVSSTPFLAQLRGPQAAGIAPLTFGGLIVTDLIELAQRLCMGEHVPPLKWTAQVADGWRVVSFTGSTKRHDDDRWEVYDPTGSGGVVRTSDIGHSAVRGLLDALAEDGDQEPWSAQP
jgi:hypothetical protein